MEDFYETRIDGVDGEVVGLFRVFDGIVLTLCHCFMNRVKLKQKSSVSSFSPFFLCATSC